MELNATQVFRVENEIFKFTKKDFVYEKLENVVRLDRNSIASQNQHNFRNSFYTLIF